MRRKCKKGEQRNWTNNLKNETTELIGNELAINTVHEKPPDNCEAQIQQHKNVEDENSVTRTSWQW